jgi:hypothetical protein
MGLAVDQAQIDKVTQAIVVAWDSAHPGLLGIAWEAWAIVLATFLGPIAAITITIWRDKRSQIHER